MSYLLFLAHILFLFLVSRFVMHRLFHGLQRLTHSPHFSFYVLSLLYLPGTVLHEAAHACMSIILFVTPTSLNLIPEIDKHDTGYNVRFGSVHHHKTDPFRGILIGIAPLFAGLAFFYLMASYHVFDLVPLWGKAALVYLFFSVSSNMFLSKTDLQDGLILIPIVILGISLVYGFKIDAVHFFTSPYMLQIVANMNMYLLTATIINTLFAAMLALLSRKSG